MFAPAEIERVKDSQRERHRGTEVRVRPSYPHSIQGWPAHVHEPGPELYQHVPDDEVPPRLAPSIWVSPQSV